MSVLQFSLKAQLAESRSLPQVSCWFYKVLISIRKMSWLLQIYDRSALHMGIQLKEWGGVVGSLPWCRYTHLNGGMPSFLIHSLL